MSIIINQQFNLTDHDTIQYIVTKVSDAIDYAVCVDYNAFVRSEYIFFDRFYIFDRQLSNMI